MSTTAIAFLLVFGALLLAALFRNPRYGLYAYVGTFYLHPIDRWWGSDLPDLRWALIAAMVTMVATLRLPDRPNRCSWTASTGTRLLIALAAWIWIQNLWALAPADHLELSVLYTKYVVLIYLIYRLVDDEENIRNFLIAHCLGCFYLGVLILQAPDSGRLEGVGGPGIDEANALGMHLGTGALAAGVLLLRGSLAQRAFALAALAVLVNGVIQTESRGAFIGVAAGSVTMLVLSPPSLRKYGLALGVIGVFALMKLAPENYWERIATIATTTEQEAPVDQSSATRLELVAAQWEMFLDYPMGSGHRGTAELSPRYLSDESLTNSRKDPNGMRARSSHNTFMTALAEQGIPGILLFVGLLFWIVKSSYAAKASLLASGNRELQEYLMVASGSLGTVVAAGMFTDYFKAEIFIWAIALLAVITAGTELVKTSSGATESDKFPGKFPLPQSTKGSPPGNL
ncbi:MAG: O-antigen ligase family protein [Gammaproteobacteria bacterium]